MKRLLTGMLAFLSAGCAGSAKPVSLEPMDIQLKTENYRPEIVWERPEGEDVHYDVMIHTVSGSDGGKAGMIMYVIPVDYEYFSGRDYVAYYAQENDYYGPMQYQVTAYRGEKAFAQGTSDIFMAQDYFPAETEIIIGQDVDPEDINTFMYSGSGTYAESSFSFSVTTENQTAVLNADYYDETGNHTTEKELREEEYAVLKQYLEHGTISRIQAEDPEMEVLDGSRESMRVFWNGMSRLQKDWYEFIAAEGERQDLIDYLYEISK